MTREDAIEFIAQSVKSDVDMAKVADAIKTLEQDVLDKIRAEIKKSSHVKWLLTEQRDMVYNTLYQSINDYLMNDINKICVVNKPFTEDDIIQLCNEIENNSYNKWGWTKFDNGVAVIKNSLERK